MGVRVVTGDIFQSKARTLVNPVNCVGVMGAGVAAEFKKRFPQMFEAYREQCRSGAMRPGRPLLWQGGPRNVVNFPTKIHWRDKSDLLMIEVALGYMQMQVAEFKAWPVESLAVPALGCGLGGLDWATVRPVLLYHLQAMGVPVELYGPR